MSPVTVAVLAGIAADAIIVLGTISLWLGYRARRAPRPEDIAILGERLDARLTEMSSAISAIAVEVERIGEAQRYLMLERQRLADSRSLHGRVNTPH